MEPGHVSFYRSRIFKNRENTTTFIDLPKSDNSFAILSQLFPERGTNGFVGTGYIVPLTMSQTSRVCGGPNQSYNIRKGKPFHAFCQSPIILLNNIEKITL